MRMKGKGLVRGAKGMRSVERRCGDLTGEEEKKWNRNVGIGDEREWEN